MTTQPAYSLSSNLPSFGIFQNESQLFSHILHDRIGIDHFFVTEFSVGTGTKVIGVFVPNNTGKLSFIIKLWEGKTSELARELSSLQKIRDLNLQKSTWPTAQAAGQFHLAHNTTPYHVLVQTAALGMSFTTLLDALGKAVGVERNEHLKILTSGFMKAAQGLAELHLINHHLASSIPQEIIDFNFKTLKDVYQWVKDSLHEGRIPLTLKELEAIYAHVTKAVVGKWGIAGYSHGDTHLDNLFFDPASDQFSFIDTSSFLASVGEKGNPIGFPSYDYAWTFGSISGKGFRSGLTEKEVIALQTIFKTEYQRLMGSALPSQEAQNFAILTKKLFWIGNANFSQKHLLKNIHSYPDAAEKIARLQKIIDFEATSIRQSVF